MMNLIALSLVATSFAVAGVFSPTPQNNYNNGGEQVIVRNGHQAVVVEYADIAGDSNTKVSISPKPNKPDVVEEQLSRAAASIAGVAQEGSGRGAQYGPHGASPRELICDAYGKCKHKIAGAWNKAKDKVVEVEEVVEEAVDKAKDLVSKATRVVEESSEGVRDSAKEMVKDTGEVAERVKAKMGEKVEDVKGKTGDFAESVKEKVGEKVENVKEKTGELVEETGEMIKEKGKKGKKELSDIAQRGKDVIFVAIKYIFWSDIISSLMNVIHVFGFAMAYGISMWVTFIMSHVLAGVLPRQQFGLVQSKMYPVYFKAMAASIGLALLGHLVGRRNKLFENKGDMLQACNLMGSILSAMANLLFLEPKATKVMVQRMKLEKEEGRGREHASTATSVADTVMTDEADPVTTTTTTTTSVVATPRKEQATVKSEMAKLEDKLKKLNSYSSLLNISSLIGLTWHLIYLSQRLQVDSS